MSSTPSLLLSDDEFIRRTMQQATIVARDPDPGYILDLLGTQTISRYRVRRNDELLELALQLSADAVERTPNSHPGKAQRLHNYGGRFAERFRRFGERQDLESSIVLAEKALGSLPSGSTIPPQMLEALAIGFATRGGLNNDTEDVRRAIQRAEEAVGASQNGIDKARALGLHSSCLGTSYVMSGAENDLHQAISKVRLAIDMSTNADPWFVDQLVNFSSLLMSVFGRQKDETLLDEAADLAQKALEATGVDHINRAQILNTLSSCFRCRFEHLKARKRSQAMEALSKAIDTAEEARTYAPLADHRAHGLVLNNLGGHLAVRYLQTGNKADLQDAICRTKEAISSTPKNHSYLASYWHNLSTYYAYRSRVPETSSDLHEAIRYAQQATKSLPANHPIQTVILYSLGHQLGVMGASDSALDCFLRSWNNPGGTPFERLNSALSAIEVLEHKNDWVLACKIAQNAVKFLPRLCKRSLGQDDQLHVLESFSGLAAKVCSLMLQTGGDLAETLELLEYSRGTILGFFIDNQTGLAALKTVRPQMAARYERLQSEINTPTKEGGAFISESAIRRRLKAMEEFEYLVEDIRQLSGFDGFLRPPTSVELMSKINEGSVVIVNLSSIRSDSLIVSSSGVKLVNLPDCTFTDAQKFIQEDLTSYSNFDCGKKNKRYLEFLCWLWKTCVSPILSTIRAAMTPEYCGQLFRVWWIGVGVASFLPFHAAGNYYTSNDSENALSWTIPSYTPTIKALNYARENAIINIVSRPKLLVATMSNTPGQASLPGVEREREEIEKAAGKVFSVKGLSQPSVDKVLEELRDTDVAHFACHGCSVFEDPSDSHMIFEKEQEADKLTVRQILAAQLDRPQLAYLAACSTAQNRAVHLLDEVIHVASGFQLAGFTHVIGCLWPASDYICTELAKEFYPRISAAYNSSISEKKNIAEILRESLIRVRSQCIEIPLDWAPYVHYGP